MDVIGVGFGRTGTLSLKNAVERLGFGPCLHMTSMFEAPERAELFMRAVEGDPGALEAAMAGFRSTVDWPGTYFWRQLTTDHPDAKVILTVRDPQAWYESAQKTIFQAATIARQGGAIPAGAVIDMIDALVWEGTFGGRFADRERAIRIFEEHNAAVRREVPADRLLEFQVSQGWEPLCAFLGVPVPDEPFPRTNDREEFQARVAAARR
jgi:hypothetical protein